MILNNLNFIPNSLIEDNFNPILVFNHNESVIYFNKSAELLSGIHLSKKIFLLATSYASKNFGSSFEYIDLLLADERFYAIMVAYENSDEICISLYKKPISLFSTNDEYNGYIKSDINSLLQTNIEYFLLNYKSKFKLFTDYDIPAFFIHQNSFCLILQEIFSYLYQANTVEIDMHIKVGKVVFIKKKRCLIVSLSLKYDTSENIKIDHIEKIANKNHISLINTKNTILLEVPSVDI